jgi:glucosylceramidase
MVGRFNRREFMKLSAAGAVGATLSVEAAAAAPTPATAGPNGNLEVWQTAGAARHQSLASLKWGTQAKQGARVVEIDPTREFQSVLGFGAALTDAACFTINRLSPDARKQLMHELFHPSELGFNVSRVCIGASDYSTKAYSYSEGTEPDPDLARFSIEHDRAYILPVLREARALSPDMWLMATPWSPPAWMKFNGSMLGGTMRKKWLKTYSVYFEKFLDAYAAEGVRINSVTSQNEVDTDQDGRMPACTWPQEIEIEFIRDFLGPKMKTAKNPADIWILDHNYNLWGRVLDTLEDEKVSPFIKGVAWHGYVGTPDAMTKVAEKHPQVDQFWTEGGPDFEKPGYETEWTKWAGDFTDVLRNRARSIIAWNYALDEAGKPNIGPFQCAGVVTVDSKTAAITRGGQYWAFAHFSRHIRKGAKIVASSSKDSATGIQHVVARNSDNSYVAVLTNKGTAAADVSLRLGTSSVDVNVPADSVTTLKWS